MKNNIDYYPHYTNAHTHPKFKLLRVKYGWEGEGKFWALNNMIGTSENCELDISRKFLIADILELFAMTKKQFDEFISYLVSDCELIQRNGNAISTEIVKETLAKAETKRDDSRNRYGKKKDNSGEGLDAETNILDAEKGKLGESPPLSKAKHSKGEESIVQQKGKLPENIFSVLDKKLPINGQYNEFKPTGFSNDSELREAVKNVLIHFTNLDITELLLDNIFDRITDLDKYEYLNREIAFQLFFNLYSNLSSLADSTKQEIKNPPGYFINVLSSRIKKENDSLLKLEEKKISPDTTNLFKPVVQHMDLNACANECGKKAKQLQHMDEDGNRFCSSECNKAFQKKKLKPLPI